MPSLATTEPMTIFIFSPFLLLSDVKTLIPEQFAVGSPFSEFMDDNLVLGDNLFWGQGFSSMLKHYDEHAPLGRNVTHEELGQTGVFLASDGGAAITGQVIYVDCGYQIMG